MRAEEQPVWSSSTTLAKWEGEEWAGGGVGRGVRAQLNCRKFGGRSRSGGSARRELKGVMPRAVGGWMAGFDTRADRERSLCVPLGRLRADRPRAIGAALTELGTFWIWRLHNAT